jgi:hypothetical protein
MKFDKKQKTLCSLFSTVFVVLLLESKSYYPWLPNNGEKEISLSQLGQSKRPELSQQNKKPRFAYAYAVAGCTEASCLGYVLNVLASKHLLQSSGSVADVVMLVRMLNSIPSGNSTVRLDPAQEDWLLKAGVTLKYLPQVKIDNIGTATLEKFRILDMVEYDRIVFLDSDIIPQCNTDYLHWESYKADGLFSNYVGISGELAPITAAYFLVTPVKGAFKQVMDIARKQIQDHESFPRTSGWGQIMNPPDHWKSWKRQGTMWNFNGAEIDQGILYMYFKYVLMNYTQIHPKAIETWQDVTFASNETLKAVANISVKVQGTDRVLAKVNTKSITELPGCGVIPVAPHGRKVPVIPYFIHFGGNMKPWKKPILSSNIPDVLGEDNFTAREFWLYHLAKANRTFGLLLPVNITSVNKGNPLGQRYGSMDLFSDNVDLPQ